MYAQKQFTGVYLQFSTFTAYNGAEFVGIHLIRIIGSAQPDDCIALGQKSNIPNPENEQSYDWVCAKGNDTPFAMKGVSDLEFNNVITGELHPDVILNKTAKTMLGALEKNYNVW
jgi:hypothetical protein